jgi:hypothetical protein
MVRWYVTTLFNCRGYVDLFYGGFGCEMYNWLTLTEMDHHGVPPSGCCSSHRHRRTFRRINLAQVQSFPGDLANTVKSISLSSQRHNRLGLRIKLLYYSQKTQRGTCGAINCMQRNYETRSVYMQSSQNDDKRCVAYRQGWTSSTQHLPKRPPPASTVMWPDEMQHRQYSSYFTYGLFNDTFSTEYKAWTINKWERIWEELWPNFRCYLCICAEGLKKHKRPQPGSGPRLEPRTFEYEGVVTYCLLR